MKINDPETAQVDKQCRSRLHHIDPSAFYLLNITMRWHKDGSLRDCGLRGCASERIGVVDNFAGQQESIAAGATSCLVANFA